MEIIVLGSGGFIPTKKQKSSSYLLKHRGDYFLLDCGCGGIQRLIELKFDWTKINHIFISHFHIDHINDLLVLLHSQVTSRRKTLKIFGPKNIKRIGDFIRKELSGSITPPRFIFNNITSKKIRIKNLKIEIIPVKHHELMPSIAYKFIADDKTTVYSGDLGPMVDKNKFIKFCKNADLLIADSGGNPNKPGGDHLNPKEVGELAQKARVKKLILTHQIVNLEKTIINNCKKSYSGEIIVAKDLMKIKI